MTPDPRRPRRTPADAGAWADRLERWLAVYRARVDALVDEAPDAFRRAVRLARQPKVIEATLAIALVIVGGRVVRWALKPESRAWFKTVTGEESLVEGIKGVGALAMLQLTQPRLQLAPDAPIDHLAVSPYGVNTFLQLEPDEEVVKRSFERMRAAGIGWARQQFPWEDIEIHARGDFEDRRNDPARPAWDKYDRIVHWSDVYDVQLLVRLDNPPDWAYADVAAEGEARMGPPSDLADYANFVKAVAGRYCGRVRYYQIWNEPNIYPEWGERKPDPAGYAKLLNTAAAAARSVCNDVVVVSAALSPTTEQSDRNVSDLDFLRDLYELEQVDAAAYPNGYFEEGFDVLGAQGFGLWTGPTDRRASADRTNFSRVLLLRDIMVRHGDEATPIWLTEFGWDSPPEKAEDGTPFPATYGRVTEALRAEYTRDAYERLQDEWPFVGVACLWFLRRPDREWHSRPEGWFRLLEPDWTELPAYAAVKEIGRRSPRLMRGRHAVTDPALFYSGPWRDPSDTDLGLATRFGSTSAELNFSFRGTGWRLVLDPYSRGTAPQDDEGDKVEEDEGKQGRARHAWPAVAHAQGATAPPPAPLLTARAIVNRATLVPSVSPSPPATTTLATTSTLATTATLATNSTAVTTPTLAVTSTAAVTPTLSPPTPTLAVTATKASDLAPSATLTGTAPLTGPITLFVFRDSVTRTVTIASGEAEYGEDDLPFGDHSVILRIDAGELPLDEVRITAPDPPDPLRPLKLGLLRWALYIAAAVAAVLAFRRFRRRTIARAAAA